MINIIRLKEKRCVIIFRDIKNAFNLMYFLDYLHIGKIGGKFKLLNLQSETHIMEKKGREVVAQ